MDGLDSVVARLSRATEDPLVPAGRITLGAPATPEELRGVRDGFGDALTDALRPLLEICVSFSIDGPEDEDGYGDFGLHFGRAGSAPIWESVYPGGFEIGMAEEFLYWDIGSGIDGHVFFVHHDGPYHCMRFEGLAECLMFMLTDPQPFRSLESSVQEKFDWPRVDGVDHTGSDLASFLAPFPGHYRVIDIRDQPLCTAFPYGGGDLDQFTRWGHELVWVQSRPKPLWTRIREALGRR